jgi:hypothetical protein
VTSLTASGLDALSILSACVGLAGGVLGIASWFQTRSDRKARRALVHVPDETLPLLKELIEVSLPLERQARSPEWIAENVLPLKGRWDALAHVATAARRGDAYDFGSVGLPLAELCLCLDREGRVRENAEWLAEAQSMQGNAARNLTDSATALHHRLTGTKPSRSRRRPARNDGSDESPHS